MSGHSKWSTIRRKKSSMDAKRGKAFTKIIREITVAARLGGGEPNANARLRIAIEKAKAANMPQENIQRAIQKGTGELEGVHYEEVTYEGYGPGGVAVLVQALTDNRNRTVADIRKLFARNGGSLGETNSVAWNFEKKGLLLIEKERTEEETLLGVALEAGAEDMRADESMYHIITAPADFEEVRRAVEAQGIPIHEAEVTMVPKASVRLEGKEALQMLRLMEGMEDHDDVQHVYANFDIPEGVMAEVAS